MAELKKKEIKDKRKYTEKSKENLSAIVMYAKGRKWD
jgi:hypothetical protein